MTHFRYDDSFYIKKIYDAIIIFFKSYQNWQLSNILSKLNMLNLLKLIVYIN